MLMYKQHVIHLLFALIESGSCLGMLRRQGFLMLFWDIEEQHLSNPGQHMFIEVSMSALEGQLVHCVHQFITMQQWRGTALGQSS